MAKETAKKDGSAPLVVVSRERLAEFAGEPWDGVLAAAEVGGDGVSVKVVDTYNGLPSLGRPDAGFATLRRGQSGCLKDRAILQEQNW